MKFLITVMATFVLVANAGLTSPTCEYMDTSVNVSSCRISTNTFKRCVPKGSTSAEQIALDNSYDLQKSQCDTLQSETCGVGRQGLYFCQDLMTPFCKRHYAKIEVERGCIYDIDCDDAGNRSMPATVCCSFIEANEMCGWDSVNTELVDDMVTRGECSRNSSTCFTPSDIDIIRYTVNETNQLNSLLGILSMFNTTDDSSASQTPMMFTRMLSLVMTVMLGVWYY
jgi:hypothetical protein